MLNSRPLYALHDEPSDSVVITPGHFLINEPFVLPPPIASPRVANNKIKNIRAEQQKLLESFWNSWRNEYLVTLMQRKKWAIEKAPIQIGQIVLVNEENTSPTHWPLGKIVDLIKSRRFSAFGGTGNGNCSRSRYHRQK